MSQVHLAENINTGENIAIKVTRQAVGQAEIAHLQNLSHPGVPRIEGVVCESQKTLIFMEYICGESLHDRLVKSGPQPCHKLLDWMIQLCQILLYLHSRNPPIIYRDLKPSNIILQPCGSLKLIDFGAAREYRQGAPEDTVLIGTRGYAAPEQYGGYGQTDARTDIYGLGATIYHLATSRDPSKPPYMKFSVTRWARDVPKKFASIIEKCTSLTVEHRYQDCHELMDELFAIKEEVQHLEEFRHKDSKFLIETDITVVYTDQLIS